MKQGRETTYEERIQIVRDCISNGKNYGEMAVKYQVSYQQVRSWTLRFEQLRHKLYLAEMENTLLKKLDEIERCLSEVRQQRIYTAIQSCHEDYGFPIERDCELLHASRSAYHKWASGKLSPGAVVNEQLADKIKEIHLQSPDKGCRRLNDDLRHDHGIYVNDKKVLRICRAGDIRSTTNSYRPE